MILQGFSMFRCGLVCLRVRTRKILIFATFHFLLGLGYVAGFFSVNAMLISRFGTSHLFYVYLGQGVATLLLSSLFYFLSDRLSRRSFFFVWFLFLGFLVTASWVLLHLFCENAWIYIVVRAGFDAVAIASSLGYWLIVSDKFTHRGAKRYFATLMGAFILGDIAGGFLLHETALVLHSRNFSLLWAAILILSPFLFSKAMRLPSQRKPKPSCLKKQRNNRDPKGFSSVCTGLSFLLFLFWLAYSFFSDSTDYLFNVYALGRIRSEDELTAYFGGVALLSNLVILIYHGFFSGQVLRRFGIHLTVLAIPCLIAAVWLLTWFYPSLLTMALAQGLIYFFIDYLALARLHIPLTVFSKALRGRVKAITEGFGRACGFILLFGIAGFYAFRPEFEDLGRIIVMASFLFLAFPFLFRPVYLRHVMNSLLSRDRNLVRNAIQALGDRDRDSVPMGQAYAPPAPPFEIPGKQNGLVASV